MRAGASVAKLRLLPLVALVFAGLAALSACGGGPQEVSWGIEPFKPHFEEYMALADAPAAKDGQQPLRGKVIIMAVAERWTDYTYIRVLEKGKSPLLAFTPEELGAIVFVRYKDEQVGGYVGGSKAYTRRATLTVVDLTTKKAIARRVWKSGPPPTEVQWGMDGYGAVPVKKMLAWVEGLAQPVPAAGEGSD